MKKNQTSFLLLTDIVCFINSSSQNIKIQYSCAFQRCDLAFVLVLVSFYLDFNLLSFAFA